MDPAAFEALAQSRLGLQAATAHKRRRYYTTMLGTGFDPEEFLAGEDAAEAEWDRWLAQAPRKLLRPSARLNYAKTATSLARLGKLRVRFSAPRQRGRRPQPYTDQELERIRAFRWGHVHKDMVWQALIMFYEYTGMRPAEVFSIRRRDVDFEAGLLYVENPVKFGVVRSIPFNGEIAHPKRAFRAYFERVEFRISEDPDLLWTWPGPDGPERFSQHAARKRFHKVGPEVGVRPCNQKRFRHTRITQFRRDGVRDPYIMLWTGINDPKTLEWYGQVTLPDLVDELARVRRAKRRRKARSHDDED